MIFPQHGIAQLVWSIGVSDRRVGRITGAGLILNMLQGTFLAISYGAYTLTVFVQPQCAVACKTSET